MTGKTDLLAAYWTLAVGAEPHTDHEYSTVDFKDRVSAAARAGFTGMGFWHADLSHTLQKYSLKEMKQILDDHGIRHVELEFLTDWFVADEARKKQSDVTKQMLFSAAEALNARAIKVGDFVRTLCPMSRLTEAFATLCREAESCGARIAFEMMPFCIIDSIQSARALVEGAGAKNGGIYFDLWHIVKLGIPYEDVASFPKQYLCGVELNDGYLKSMIDFVEETTQHRQLCGEGEFDIARFVSVMRDQWDGPWGIEVLNRELRRLPIETVVQKAFSTTAAQFR
jgi:sugar phosphate isomerase/epimerase